MFGVTEIIQCRDCGELGLTLSPEDGGFHCNECGYHDQHAYCAGVCLFCGDTQDKEEHEEKE